MTRTLDLNADLGEATDSAGTAAEIALLDLVSTAHLACGGHAGDGDSMSVMAEAARQRSVRVGAHPSYPDRAGFGRRSIDMDRRDLETNLVGQFRALHSACASVRTEVRSVKPHGTLYGDVAEGGLAYEALRDALVATCRPDVTLVLPSGCRATALALRDGVPVLEEGFCDRAYDGDGGLVPRTEPGAVLTEPSVAAAQAVSLARGAVVAADGSVLTLWVDTLCVHGDTTGALAIAVSVRRALHDAGVVVALPATA